MKLLCNLSIVFCLLVVAKTIQAQNAIPVSGGNASGTGGEASYTIGQVVYITNTGTNDSEVQGVQQPYEISIMTAIERAKGIYLICSAYPNPTINSLTLKVERDNNRELLYWLYDINGTLIRTQKILSNETHISLESNTPGAYLLKITCGNKIIKTFKIIKN